MTFKTIALFALLGAAVPMSTASAVTVATPDARASASTSSTVHKTDYRDRTRYDRRYDRRRKFHHDRHRYTPGGRYERAPNHWHRHGARPRDWRTRGCIMVGPIWWCP